jgi:hypothetical protein
VSSRPNSPSSQKINTKHVSKRPARLNKAQQKAVEKRASETRWDDTATAVAEPNVAASPSGTAFTSQGVAVATKTRGKPISQGVFLLSRAQELAFIRSDMRRLIIIASGLLLVMLVLLFIVE